MAVSDKVDLDESLPSVSCQVVEVLAFVETEEWILAA
jgi:hypothetical protein